MAVTNLTKTKWLWNSLVTANTNTYNITFTSNNTTFSNISYDDGNFFVMKYSNDTVYNYETDAWLD
jgi:hypothetical protein